MATSSAGSKNFGKILWHILGGRDVDKHLAAERLGIGVCYLDSVLQGRKRVSQRYLANKRWRDVLAKYYSESWKQRSAAFERCVASFRVNRGYCPSEPKLKAGFGYVLWLILGGKKMNLEKAAEQLNIDQTYLSSIIHGRIQTSQGSVSKKGWPKVLSEHYPEGWKQYGTMFDQHTGALKKRAGVSGTEPKDRNSFGYILWLILGGKDLNARQASEDLKIHPVALSMLFHGRQPVSQKTLIKKQWREVLARAYGEGWREHADEFEKYAAALPGPAGVKKMGTKTKLR